MQDIQEKVKAYILKDICDEEETGPIDGSTVLISSGIIDSITTLQLVEYLEKTFGIEFEPHEVDHDNLDTLDRIATFVQSKKK